MAAKTRDPFGEEGFRKETDSLGGTYVAADKLWGAQTQRSLEHFSRAK
jgi:fumarate hydratase class II